MAIHVIHKERAKEFFFDIYEQTKLLWVIIGEINIRGCQQTDIS